MIWVALPVPSPTFDDLEVGHYNVGSAPQRRSELGQFTLKALIIIGCAFMVAGGNRGEYRSKNATIYQDRWQSGN
jgi:hypothetical protein